MLPIEVQKTLDALALKRASLEKEIRDIDAAIIQIRGIYGDRPVLEPSGLRDLELKAALRKILHPNAVLSSHECVRRLLSGGYTFPADKKSNTYAKIVSMTMSYDKKQFTSIVENGIRYYSLMK